jgi:FO synthase
MGIMLESSAERLGERGGPHHRSPDKRPAARLATLRAAGEQQVPFTTGILIGIGETRLERIESLLAIRELHDRHGHIQEIIVQNFRAKPGTRMAQHPEPDLADLQWTIAVARLIFGSSMSIQVPPNLSAGHLPELVAAGLNDWGGVSPVTPDHVNPEAPWPQFAALAQETQRVGRELVERLALVPDFAGTADRWLDPALRSAVLRQVDALGYVRDSDWHAGSGAPPPRTAPPAAPAVATAATRRSIERALAGERLPESAIASLFAADAVDAAALLHAADELRREVVGGTVTYVVNRNINYTNICTYSCGFCAFAKGRSARSLRGPGYRLELEEVGRRVAEAWERGATEVCLQGGIHPSYTGETYLAIVQAARRAAPAIHVHAFSPLEISHGARTLGLGLREYLAELQAEGLRTLPGTAAEILSDDIRAHLCPDKLSSAEWLEVMRAAHAVGLRSTATIMFGHLERYEHWARHLLAIRDLQAETGGFTEFVPLPFVHMEAPLWRAGRTRSGPTWREALLMHAVARLVLHPLIPNVQASWVKLGHDGVLEALAAGANDLGGVLMDESITRAAGGQHGQEMTAATMQCAIRSIGREPRERTTLYGTPVDVQRSFGTTSLPMMSSAAIGSS